ncbi:hypothetical protein CRUP_035842 [Coryphaenoides rupestris]|nr:hypothetical protein CRUP_035842 [Coryphaenoides rupestris]
MGRRKAGPRAARGTGGALGPGAQQQAPSAAPALAVQGFRRGGAADARRHSEGKRRPARQQPGQEITSSWSGECPPPAEPNGEGPAGRTRWPDPTGPFESQLWRKGGRGGGEGGGGGVGGAIGGGDTAQRVRRADPTLASSSSSFALGSLWRSMRGVVARAGGGVQGRDRQRRCLRSGSPLPSDSAEWSSWGSGGRAKVREMTDLLGVSNSLILPPCKSLRWEKGLTRPVGGATAPGVEVGGVSRGWSMSDLLRERQRRTAAAPGSSSHTEERRVTCHHH